MPKHTGLQNYRVYTTEDRHLVHVPAGRGEELREHLRSHAVESAASPPAGTSYDRVEVNRHVSAEALQALLDHWER